MLYSPILTSLVKYLKAYKAKISGRFYDYSLDFAISLENITFLPFYEPQPVKRCIKNTPLFWLEGKIYLLSAGFWMCKNKHADLYKKGGWLNDRVCVASTKQEY